MRDLRQDLEDYHRYMNERSLKVIDLMVDSLPHAIDRALRGENFIKGLNKELADAQDQKSRAEAEVERLKQDLHEAGQGIGQWEGTYSDLRAEIERLKLMVKSITEGLDEAIETNHYLEKIIDGLKADLQMVATDESTDGYPCICSICELACKCPDEKRDPYSNKDSLCKFVWIGLEDGRS